MVRRQAPIKGVRDRAVFGGVVADVVHMAGEIAIVADQVSSEAPLPEMAFAAPISNKGNTVANAVVGEPRLVRAPPALQRHFSPTRVNGRIDFETARLLRDVLEMCGN